MLQFASLLALVCLLHISISTSSIWKCLIDTFVIEHLVQGLPRVILVSKGYPFTCTTVQLSRSYFIFLDRPRQKSFTIWIMVGSSIAINTLNALDLFAAIFHSATDRTLKIE